MKPSKSKAKPPPANKKKSKKQLATDARAASDLTAQAVGRDDVDYGDIESTPMTHVTNTRAVPQKPTLTMDEWRRRRAARGTLEKPGKK